MTDNSQVEAEARQDLVEEVGITRSDLAALSLEKVLHIEQAGYSRDALVELFGKILDALPPQPTAGEWIKHDGNGRPHPPKTEVYIRRRDGREEGPGCSAFIDWTHSGGADDVVAFRLSPQSATQMSPEELYEHDREMATRNPATPPASKNVAALREKLLAKKPGFEMARYGFRNPDGPEAAARIAILRNALEQARDYFAQLSIMSLADAQVVLATIRAALGNG